DAVQQGDDGWPRVHCAGGLLLRRQPSVADRRGKAAVWTIPVVAIPFAAPGLASPAAGDVAVRDGGRDPGAGASGGGAAPCALGSFSDRTGTARTGIGGRGSGLALLRAAPSHVAGTGSRRA